MTGHMKNLSHSVRERLRNVAGDAKETFQFVLTRYAIERLLFRLAQSPHRGDFILKGAILFQVWTGTIHRATKDLDLLGFGENSTERIADVFRDVCRHAVDDDGLTFNTESIRVERIKDDDDYEGVRLHFDAMLEKARIPLQVDIGFGDAITPAAVEAEYPTLLDFAAPRLRVYPKETVIAEKFHAMVSLGIANSRLKDFYDVWTLAQKFTFEGPLLSQAMAATFNRRHTEIPRTIPLALTVEFATDQSKVKQWQAFLSRSKLASQQSDFGEVVALLRKFLWPPMEAQLSGSKPPTIWPPSGPWR